DYARASLDRKSITGGCQFLGCRLISCQCKKQTVTKIHIDNESTICIVKNPVFYSKIMHIEIRHHFIRDSNEKKLIQMIKIYTDQNVSDLLTKAFDVSRFQYLIAILPGITYYCWVTTAGLVNAVRLNLLLLVQVNAVEGDFINTSIQVAFLSKPEESNGFEQIIDFLNANPIKYALTVNLTIYTTCIQQFWATAKAKIVNRERQIQALVDKKKIIITKTSVRSDLQLDNAEGIECLPNNTIFEQLTLMGVKTIAWNEFSSTMASVIICPTTNQNFNFSKYIFDCMVKNLEGGVKFLMYPRFLQKGFSGRVTPLFQSMMAQAPEEVGKGGPTKPIPDEVATKEHEPTHSNDPLLSGEDRLQLNELMEICTNLLENTNTYQAAEIATLKERVKKMEKKRRSRTYKPRRLYKGRKIANLDADADATLIDQTQGRNDEDLMFDNGVLYGDEVFQEPIVNTDTTTKSSIPVSAADPVTTAGEAKDKGKVKMVEPKIPLKKKDQIMFDKEVAQTLQAQLEAELEEEERLASQKEEEANISLIES
ncbi:hypothetical protein Tco_0759329, partial [Tanacetum coccineum]